MEFKYRTDEFLQNYVGEYLYYIDWRRWVMRGIVEFRNGYYWIGDDDGLMHIKATSCLIGTYSNSIWKELHKLKEETQTKTYYPALALIGDFYKKYNIPYNRVTKRFNPGIHRFMYYDIVVDFKYFTTDKRIYSIN